MTSLYSFPICHHNRKGNGTAILLRIIPPEPGKGGRLSISFYHQRTDQVSLKPFDWKDGESILLSPFEVEKMLEVFRGETESINDGKGLDSTICGQTSVLRLQHQIDPIPCYLMTLVSKTKAGLPDSINIALTPTEGRLIYDGLASVMGSLMFGA